jgi:4-amino-4-deoxy-L-arabinose transferase-like glycosyltransferase
MAASEESAPAGRLPAVGAVARAHGGILLVALAALPLLLANLGAGPLWSDEADTAVFARSILSSGLPRAWDGTSFTDSDSGRRTAPNLVLVGTPWVPYYVTAGSLALLGETSFAARLPFALAGLGTLPLLYLLVLRTTEDRRAALLSAVLLLFSVQFLLYARQSRHYALNMLLSVALLLGFFRLERRRIDPVFVAIAVLLYHCHPLPAGAALATLGGLTLVHPAFRAARRGFWTSLPVVLALTVPWAFVAWPGWEENSSAPSALADLVPRVQQFAYEASVAAPFLGWLALAPFAARRLGAGDRALLALALALLGAYAFLTPLVQSANQLWHFGLRYSCALLPLAAATTGLLVVRAAAGARAPALLLAAGFVLTHVPGNLLPWLLIEPRPAPPEPPAAQWAALHVPARSVDKVVRRELVGFAGELVGSSPGTDSRIIAFLRANARPGDVVVTNYAWEPLYFHTRLPLGYTVLESYPIRAAAEAAGLPDYVFEPERARWVVWRAPWEGYQGYRWADVTARLRAAGATLERVAAFHETVFENRESLHFRRFPGVGYLYPQPFGRMPPARVYRVRPAVQSAVDRPDP